MQSGISVLKACQGQSYYCLLYMPRAATYHIDCKHTFIVSVLVLLLRATKRSGRILGRGRHTFRDSRLALAQTNLLPSSCLLNVILERKMATQRLLRPWSSPATSFAAHSIIIQVIVEAHAVSCGLRTHLCMEGRGCTHLVDPLTRRCSFLDARSWRCRDILLREKPSTDIDMRIQEYVSPIMFIRLESRVKYGRESHVERLLLVLRPVSERMQESFNPVSNAMKNAS